MVLTISNLKMKPMENEMIKTTHFSKNFKSHELKQGRGISFGN